MQKIVVAFRGNNTDRILADYGVQDDEQVLVVALPDDRLAQPGDLTAEQAVSQLRQLDGRESRLTVVANGGTTRQLVSILHHVLRGWEGWGGAFQVIDCQRDGKVTLVSRGPLEEHDRPAYALNKQEAWSLYHETSW
jgi:hypothetical protein